MEHSKTCPKCKSTKNSSCFYLDKTKKDGLSYDCKDCKKLTSSVWRENNRQKHREYSRQWIADHPKEVYAKNRAWVTENPDKARAYKRKWADSNTNAIRLKTLRRRALLAQASIFEIRPKDIARLMAQPCLYCGAKAEHIDHIIPLNKNGLHSIGNLAPSCMPCNTSKSDKYLMEWKIWKKRVG